MTADLTEARVRELMREELAAHEKRKAESFRSSMRGHLVQLQEQLNESKAKFAVEHGHVPQTPISDRLLADVGAAVGPPVEHGDVAAQLGDNRIEVLDPEFEGEHGLGEGVEHGTGVVGVGVGVTGHEDLGNNGDELLSDGRGDIGGPGCAKAEDVTEGEELTSGDVSHERITLTVDHEGQTFDKTFGLRVKNAREDRQWSQRKLAEELQHLDVKLDPSAVTRIERGTREVKLREAAAIAAALAVPLQDLAPPPSSTPREQFLSYIGRAGEQGEAARQALGVMCMYYALALHLLEHDPELLPELGTELTGIKSARQRDARKYCRFSCCAIYKRGTTS